MSKLGKWLIQSAKEARVIARGEADPRTYRAHVPADIDVKAIRTRPHFESGGFSHRFGISPGTPRDCEQNRKRPEGPARVLLVVIDKEPDAVIVR